MIDVGDLLRSVAACLTCGTPEHSVLREKKHNGKLLLRQPAANAQPSHIRSNDPVPVHLTDGSRADGKPVEIIVSAAVFQRKANWCAFWFALSHFQSMNRDYSLYGEGGMLALQVIEGHNRVRIATVQKAGIRCRGRFYLPVSMERLDQGAIHPGGSLGGAALGAMTFGAVGAIVGSVAGRRGRTAVIIRTTDGAEMVCTVASDEFPALYVEIQRLIALAATGHVPPEPARVKPEHVLLGPFYFLRFGCGWFMAAISVTILTAGFGWLLAPAVAPYLDRRRKRTLSAPIPIEKAFAPSGNQLSGAEGDLLPTPEGRTTAP